MDISKVFKADFIQIWINFKVFSPFLASPDFELFDIWTQRTKVMYVTFQLTGEEVRTFNEYFVRRQ